jgi:PPPDE putative peptidase domain
MGKLKSMLSMLKTNFHNSSSKTYRVLTNNCHSFTEHLSRYLCDEELPTWVFSPEKIVKSSFDCLVHELKKEERCKIQ